MDPNNEDTNAEEKKKLVIVCATAAAAAATAVAEFATYYLTKQPYRDEALRGQAETQRIIGVSDYTCRAITRMNRNAFYNLSPLVREMPFELDGDDGGPVSDVPSAQSATSSRKRGRPRSDSTTNQQTKKNKTVADKITSPLKQMAAALERLAAGTTDRDFAKEITEAVRELPGYDMHQKIRATRYLLLHKMEANAILSRPKEERAAYLEAFMQDDT